MVIVYGIFRGTKQMDNRVFKSKSIAEKESKTANKQFKEFNKFIKEGKIDRKPIKLVRVKPINFSRRKNISL